MRRPILYLMLPLFLIYSCKKDHSAATHPAQKLYRVSFDASGFTQQISGSVKGKQVNNLQTNSDGTGYDVDAFEYVVYNTQGGGAIHQILQKAGTPGWGTVVDSLPAGNYDIYFIGYSISQVAVDVNNKYMYVFSTYPPWPDTYFKKLGSFTVSNQAISQAVSLDRIVGKVTFKLLDTLPTIKGGWASITVSADYYQYNFDSGPSGTMKPGGGGANSIATTTNVTASAYVMNPGPFSASITCYTAAGAGIGTVSVPNVSIVPNRETILTGYLLGTNTGVTPTLGQSWGPIVTGGF